LPKLSRRVCRPNPSKVLHGVDRGGRPTLYSNCAFPVVLDYRPAAFFKALLVGGFPGTTQIREMRQHSTDGAIVRYHHTGSIQSVFFGDCPPTPWRKSRKPSDWSRFALCISSHEAADAPARRTRFEGGAQHAPLKNDDPSVTHEDVRARTAAEASDLMSDRFGRQHFVGVQKSMNLSARGRDCPIQTVSGVAFQFFDRNTGADERLRCTKRR
jgi:hypothetical protein